MQRSGGKLEEREARSVLIGIGPPVPPPQMAGLEQLKTPVNQLAPKVALQIDCDMLTHSADIHGA